MGPKGNGVYELFQLIVVFSVTLGALGVGHSMVYLVKRVGYKFEDVLSTVFSVGVIWGITLGTFVYIFYNLFPNLVQGLPASALLLGAVVIPFTLLDSYLIQGFIVDLKIKKQSFLIAIKNTLLVLLILFFVQFRGLNSNGIIYGVSLAFVLSSLIVIYSLRREYKFKFAFSLPIIKSSLSFGIRNWLGNVFLILNYKLDVLLVNYFLGVKDVGLYSIAVMIATSLFLIPSSVGPLLYSSWSAQPQNEVDVTTPKISRQILFIAFVLSLFCAAISYFLIPIFYGDQFLPSFTALLFLLPGIITMTVNYILFNNFSSRGKPQYSAYSLIIALIINVLLNIILIPKMGINGAALSSTISYTLSALISIFIFYRITEVQTSKNILMLTSSDFKDMKLSLFKLLKKN